MSRRCGAHRTSGSERHGYDTANASGDRLIDRRVRTWLFHESAARPRFFRLWRHVMPEVRLPDGAVKSFPAAVTVAQVAASIGPGLAKAALGGKVDGKLV